MSGVIDGEDDDQDENEEKQDRIGSPSPGHSALVGSGQLVVCLGHVQVSVFYVLAHEEQGLALLHHHLLLVFHDLFQLADYI